MTSFLNRTQLDEFKAWLDSRSQAYRSGKGAYQALQVHGDDMWHVLHIGNAYPEHYKAVGALAKEVESFNKGLT